MKEMAQDINNIIGTLESLNIPATFDNMNKLLGCLQLLAKIRDNLSRGENENAETA